MRFLLVLAVLAAALPGCMGSDASGDGLDAAATATDAPALPIVPRVLTWNGHIRAGLVFHDVPGHTHELGPALEPLWNMSFMLDVREPPSLLQVQLDWDATAARLLLMVGDEAEASEPVVVYEAVGDAPPLCLVVPADRVGVGMWSVMAHSEPASVDAELTFTVTIADGDVRFVPEAHRYTIAELADVIATVEHASPQPCDAA